MTTHVLDGIATRPRRCLSRGAVLAAGVALLTMAASAATTLLEFEFDEGSASAVTETLHGLTGNPSGSPAMVADAPSGVLGDKSIQFDAGEYITINDPDTAMQLDPANPSFTLQAWVKFAGTPSGRMVFFFSNGPGGAISFSVNTDRTVFVTTLGVLDANSSAVVPDDGAWHHIAVVHENGVALRYYVDGVLQATRDYTGSVIFTRTQNFFTLGAEPGGGLPYVGQVDRLKVSSGALTAEQLDSDPAMLDTDSDGMPDYWETRYGFDLNDPSDAAEDCNGDGETNLQEFQAGTHPCDSTPPTITYANGSETFDRVSIWFSEPLDPTSAQAVANYSLSGGVTVSAATLAGANRVRLTTSVQAENTPLTLTVNNVKDLTGNVIAADSTREFRTHVWQSGVVLHQFWQGVGSIAALTNDSRFPDAPTFATLEPLFEYPPNGANEGGASYGNRLSCWFSPAATDQFIFYICSDDQSNLYISTDNNPANKKLVAQEVGYSSPRTWTGTSSGDAATKQTDTFLASEWPGVEFPAIGLSTGSKYYIEALHVEGGGGDNVGVTFGRFDDYLTPPANGSAPKLTGDLVGAYLDPNVELAFTQQPTDQVGVLPSAGVEILSEDFNANNGGFTVVNTDPAPPGPWVYDSATGKWVANGGVPDCTGPYNSQLNSPGYVMDQDGKVSLSFSHRYSFEGDYYDGGQVRISVNGGAFTPVPAENFTANGYAAGNIVGTGVLNGQRAFNGDSPGYASETFITSEVLLGTFSQSDVIVVQFVGAWDECTTGSTPGWVIDSLKLTLLPMIIQDFAAGDGGFTVEDSSSPPPANWGPWIYDAAGGQWSADGSDTECGGPFNSKLTSPGYVVPQSDEVTLTFTHRYRFEGDYYDGGQVRISVNGGEFTPVPPDNFTANGYAAGNIIGSGILNGQRAFNGDSAGYEAGEFIQSSVILGTFSQGDTLAVQFVGGWDECWSPGQPAWQIKDLQLVIGKAAQAVTFTGEAVANAGGPTTVSYQWQRNDGAGFVDIDGATASSLRFYPVAADFEATFQLVASVLNNSITSDVVKLVEGSVVTPQISVDLSGGSVVLTFTGTLVSAADPAGPYDAVEGAQSPYTVPAGASAAFYRSRE
jgi:hypothetical protein